MYHAFHAVSSPPHFKPLHLLSPTLCVSSTLLVFGSFYLFFSFIFFRRTSNSVVIYIFRINLCTTIFNVKPNGEMGQKDISLMSRCGIIRTSKYSMHALAYAYVCEIIVQIWTKYPENDEWNNYWSKRKRIAWMWWLLAGSDYLREVLSINFGWWLIF